MSRSRSALTLYRVTLDGRVTWYGHKHVAESRIRTARDAGRDVSQAEIEPVAVPVINARRIAAFLNEHGAR